MFDVSATDAARAGTKLSKNDYDSVQSGTIDFLTETRVSPMSVYIVTRDNEVEIFEKVSSKSVTISKSEFEDMKKNRKFRLMQEFLYDIVSKTLKDANTYFIVSAVIFGSNHHFVILLRQIENLLLHVTR